MEIKNKIGQLIKEEVKQKGLKAKEFAQMINVTEKHVYKIYNQYGIDTTLLARIGSALNHNFFVDIVNNPCLSKNEDPLAVQELNNKLIVMQFLEKVPDVLDKLGIDACICLSKLSSIEKDIPVPDYSIEPYSISFSLGSFLIDKYLKKSNVEELSQVFCVKRVTSKDGKYSIDQWKFINKAPDTINIVLDIKTDDEWEGLLRFVFGTFFNDSVSPNIEKLSLDYSQIKMITKELF